MENKKIFFNFPLPLAVVQNRLLCRNHLFEVIYDSSPLINDCYKFFIFHSYVTTH